MSNETKTGMIPLSDWGKLMSAFDNGGMPMPFVKEIFLMECFIAGLGHVENLDERIAGLKKDSCLTLKREPKNKYDRNAILVLNENGDKLGYIPREKNEALANLQDNGKLLYARVKKKIKCESWPSITIRVFMRDI